MNQRNIRIYLTWLCGQHGISLLPWDTKTLAIGRDKSGKFVFYVFQDWLFSSDPEIFEILEGGFYHEALGHGRHTTFDEFIYLETDKFKWNKLARNIHNILEDIFIELSAMKIYPTVGPALIRTVDLLNQREFFGTEQTFQKSEPVNLLTGALLNFCRGNLLPGQDKHLQANMDALNKVLPNALGDLWPQVWDIAKEAANAKSSLETALLTRRIIELIKDVADEADSQHGQQDDSDQSQDEQNGNQEGSSEGQGGDEDEGAGNGKQASDQSGNNPSDASDSNPGNPSKESRAAQKILDAANSKDVTTQELSEVIAKAIDKSQKGEASSGAGYEELIEMPTKFSAQSPEVIKVAAVIKSASNDLEELLLAETFTKRELVERGSRIDKKQLTQGAAGFTSHIFSKETKGEGLSTAIYGLFDYSGSMNANIVKGCSSGLIACEGIMNGLGEILDEYEVPYEFSAFSDEFMTFKSFDSDGDMLRRKRVSPDISGGTVTGAATQLALSRLACRNESRKLLLIVTDGDTCDVDLLVSCYNEAKYMGIEVASVMLGEMIPSIKALSSRTKMKAITTNQVLGLGRFVVNQIKSAI